MPWRHRHRRQDEIHDVVAGSGRARPDGGTIDLRAWGVLRVAPAVMRSFEDGMDVICVGGRKPAGGDIEHDRAFWP
jgi:hypothetical protein